MAPPLQPARSIHRGFSLDKRPNGGHVPYDPAGGRINWGGIAYEHATANKHFLIAGVQGTGKTLTIRMLMRSVLAGTNHSGAPRRAVLYDPKQEFLPLLLGMGVPPEKILILNPFDARCGAWDLSADYTRESEALQLARTLIPEPQSNSQPFFNRAAAAVLTTVIIGFMWEKARNGTAWTLRDLLLACKNMTRIEAILDRLEGEGSLAAARARQLLSGEKSGQDVLSELQSNLSEFDAVAALWSHSPSAKAVSITSFLASDGQIILLGANDRFSRPLSAINRLFFKRLSELVLDRPGEMRDRTWFFMDETRELGKIDGLTSLLNKGRSKGACVVLGFQDFAGMKTVYGELEAEEITSMCWHKIFLRLGAESSSWASELFGSPEFLEAKPSQSASLADGFNLTSSDAAEYSSVSIVLPQELVFLPPFEEGRGLSGFVHSPHRGYFRLHVPSASVLALTGDASGVSGFQAQPEAHEQLHDWREGEAYFGVFGRGHTRRGEGKTPEESAAKSGRSVLDGFSLGLDPPSF